MGFVDNNHNLNKESVPVSTTNLVSCCPHLSQSAVLAYNYRFGTA